MTIKRLKAPYDGYGIDSNGTVWSFKGADGKKAKVSPREDHSGYLRVNLADGGSSKNGFKEIYVHKLVCQAFKPGGKGEIHHIDANKKNNAASNLSWVTKSENAVAREKDKRDKKTDSEDTVDILEWFEWRGDSFHDTPQWTITPEGYLHARKAKFAKEGILDYTATGGSVEWVTKEALQSLVDSIRGKPVTREHPKEREVNSRTARQLLEGTVLFAWVEEDQDDETKLAAYGEVIIYDALLVRDVLAGLVEVSPGYDATISIVPPGQEDQFGGAQLLQTSRHANHLAITKAGRGGPDVSIRLDAATEEEDMEDKKEVEDLKAKNDALQKELDSTKAKNDALQAKNDAFEQMLKKKEEEDPKEDEKKNDSKMVAYFNERQEALNLATRLKVAVNDSDSNHVIRAACVKSALGDKFTRLDSADAVLAAFEAVAITTPKNQPSDLAGIFRHNDSNVPSRVADPIFDFYSKDRG